MLDKSDLAPEWPFPGWGSLPYSGAIFSECRDYRYVLWRVWDRKKPCLMVVGLNLSTADETEDDQTIKRCKRFAADWGFGGLGMLNLFAIRATDPRVMKSHPSPIGENNDRWLEWVSRGAGMVLAAWGAHGSHDGRHFYVRALLLRSHVQLKCLGVTKGGHPKHPLRLRADTQPVDYDILLQLKDQ